MDSKLQERLNLNKDRHEIILQVKEDYLHGKIALATGRKILKEKLAHASQKNLLMENNYFVMNLVMKSY